jgi:pyruvate/2-oxoglutarate dehydrogenase complex dihydrolipoamide dehydrogenase (E3) component
MSSTKDVTVVPLQEIEDVDLLVVGDGKAGKSLAMDCAKAGWSVAMVESDKIGGSCINVACIPTKALVASVRTLVSARRAGEIGIEMEGEPAVSLERPRAHKEGVVGGMVAAHAKMFRESGMDFVMGTGRFVGKRTVEVAVNGRGMRTFRGRDVLVNTRPATVPSSSLSLTAPSSGRMTCLSAPAAYPSPRTWTWRRPA